MTHESQKLLGGDALDFVYIYDDLHRLTDTLDADPQGDDAESFALDRLSNRTNYTKNAGGGPATSINYGDNNRANEYSTIDNVAVEYDAAGNLYQDENDYRFFYDFENRLIRVEKLVAGGFGPQTFGTGAPGATWTMIAAYSYDALGRRIRASVSDGQWVTSESFYYDGQRLLAEYNSPGGTLGTPAHFFIDGPTYIDEHLVIHDGFTGVDHYYLPQELHTVAGLVDEDGNLVESYRYDAYGAVSVYDATGQWQPTSTVGNPYFFTGRRLDIHSSGIAIPRLDLYHYRARTLNSRDGRFNQHDPLEYVDGMNLYEYVRSSPQIWTDPFGLDVYHLRPLCMHSYVFVHQTEIFVVRRKNEPKPKHAIGAGRKVGLLGGRKGCGVLWQLDAEAMAKEGVYAGDVLPKAANIKQFEFVTNVYYVKRRHGNLYYSYDLLPAGTAWDRGDGKLSGLLNIVAGIVAAPGVVTREEWGGLPDWEVNKKRTQDAMQDWVQFQRLEGERRDPPWFSLPVNNCLFWANRLGPHDWEPPKKESCVGCENP